MASSVDTINSLLNQFTAANNAVVTGLQTGANVSSAEDTRDSIVTQLAQQIGVSTHRGRQWLGVDLHRQRRHPVPGHAAHGFLHPDADAGRWRERQCGHRRRRADHRRQFADAHSIGRARRLCGDTRYARARISGPARPDRRRPHQRLRRKRSVRRPQRCPRCRACSPRRERPACPRCRRRRVSPPRSRSIRMSTPRRAAIRICCATAASPTPEIRPTPTTRPARRAIRGASRSSSAQISATQSFDPSAGLGSSASLTDYANASVSWLQAPEPAGERRLLLSERGRNPGDLGVVERDRRQSRHRNDQHAEPRKLLRFDGEAVDDRQQHVLRPAAGGMTTVSANFVSTNYLANSLVAPVMQAQSQLTSAMTEESTGAIRRSRPAARRPVRLRTLAEGAGRPAADADHRQQRRFDQPVDCADRAHLPSSQAPRRRSTIWPTWTPSGNSGASLQNMGQSALQSLIASANTTSGDQYVFGGINSAVAPMADYYSTPTSAAKTAIDQAFQTTFGVLPTDPAAANISASAMQSFLSGPFAALFQGASWSADWSSASSVNTSAEIAPGQTVTTSTNANQPGFQAAGASLHDAERVRRLRAQQRCAAGRGHGRLLARFAGRRIR